MTALRVLIDGVVFENNQQRGIQRYYGELLRRLPGDLNCTCFFDRPRRAVLPQGVDVVYRTEIYPVTRQDLWGRARRKAKRLFWPTRLPEADVFHSTFFTRSPVPGLPEVVTVHDMVAECMPEHFAAAAKPQVAQKRECILQAAAIIAISEATRDDLLRIYPEVADRVTVIHHGADHLQVSPVKVPDPGGKDRYVLFVGDRSDYKNFETLVAAVVERDWPQGLILKVVGREFTAVEHQLLRYHGIESKVSHAGWVTDGELQRLYQAAAAFVFPSRCEGFGFPLLEAQHMGVPVLASDIPVFREIGGNSVVFFNPGDPATIIRAIVKTLAAGERERLVTLGRENVRRFTWAACAQKTAGVLRATARP
jgi:glycosyltransferase involved in cell wall biosynthesis